MILSTKLTHFRKHRNLSLDFTHGLCVLKGMNEAGKSSVLEAILYALFGSAALRTNFADAITHGEPESSLKVEVEAQIADRRLTFKRGKSGAEVIEAGTVIVTGQKEVTNYAGTLLGTTPAGAMHLMVANQGALRGVLEQGPKATSEFVEALAEFDLFDRLLEAMQTHLMLGNTSAIEAQVAEAEGTLSTLAEPVQPDFKTLEGALSDALDAEKKTKDAYAPYVEAVAAAQRELDAVRENLGKRDSLRRELDESGKRKARTERDREGVAGLAKLPVEHEEIKALRGALQDAKLLKIKREVYQRLVNMPVVNSRWEGDHALLVQECTMIEKSVEDTRRTIAENEKTRAVLASTLVTASTCGFCGQDVSQWPEVAKKNAETQVKIEELDARIETGRSDLKAYSDYLKDLRSVLSVGLNWAWIEQHRDWLEIERDVFPPQVKWRGDPPDAVEISKVEERLAELEELAKTVSAAAAKLAVYDKALADETETQERTALALQQFDHVDETAKSAHETLDMREKERISYTSVITEASAAVWNAKQALDTAKDQYVSIKLAYDSAVAVLESKRELLRTMQFNNSLLKKVRAARPIVSDKLWNTVLHSVSTMFTRMRGEQSVVSKDKDGFKVNGQNVESLSGSTLDILALAIRVSLVKVFLPNSNFLVLDEAASACDLDRSAALYGFLKTAGFDQVLLVTHDDIGASVADQLVEIA